MKRGAEQLISSKEKKIKTEQIQYVPNEIWQVIFAHLPPSFLGVVRQVSTGWRALVQNLSEQSLHRYFPYLINHPDYRTQSLRLFMKEYQRYQKNLPNIAIDVILSILQGNIEDIVSEADPDYQETLYGLRFVRGYPLPEKGLSEENIFEIKRWAIVFAAWQGNTKFLEELLTLQGIQEMTSLHKEMALECAAQSGHAKAIEKLVAHGVDVDTHFFRTRPILLAAHEGHVEVIAKLVGLGANVNAAMNDGATPTHVAAYEGHVEAIVKLVELGANVNATTNKGATPIFIAAQEGHAKLVQFLLKQNVHIQPYISSVKSLSDFAKSRGSVVIDRMEQFILEKIQEGSHLKRIPLLPSEIAYIMGYDEIVNMFKTSSEVVITAEAHLCPHPPAMTFTFNAKKDLSSSSSEEGTMETDKNNRKKSFFSRDCC